MANTGLSMNLICFEALRVFGNALEKRGVKRRYVDSFQRTGAEQGDTLMVREPLELRFDEPFPFFPVDNVTSILLDQHYVMRCALEQGITAGQFTLDQVARMVIVPGGIGLANKVEKAVAPSQEAIFVDLDLPQAIDAARACDQDLGVAIRCCKFLELGVTPGWKLQLDFLFGKYGKAPVEVPVLSPLALRLLPVYQRERDRLAARLRGIR